ncbi:hypothetical protein ABPG72_001670 [Tetrahymena utriculariae]
MSLNNNIDRSQEENGSIQKTNVLASRIQEPLKLKILILQGTEIMVKELENIRQCSKLIKLDISSNKIQTFPKNVSFKNLTSLKLLYLHNNLIDDAESLYKVFEIPNLMYLTIFNNPLSTKWSLRHFVVNSMPKLFALDFNAISDEERMEMISKTDRFYALSPSTKINWPLISIPSETVLQDDDYLLLMREEIKIIIKKYSENSPVVIIQRIWRGYVCRKQLKSKLKTAEDRLQMSLRVSQHWKKHTMRKLTLKTLLQERGKEYLLYEKKSYQFHRSLDMLKKLFRDYLYRFRIKKQMQMAARIILKAFKKMKQFLNSYQQVLFPQPALPYQQNKSNQITPANRFQSSQYKQNQKNSNLITHFQNLDNKNIQPSQIIIYFHRDQVREFNKIFNDCQKYIQNQDKVQGIYDDIKKNLFSKYVKKAEKVLGFRVIESQESKNHIYYSKYPFNALMRPSLRSKVLFTKTDQKYYEVQYHPFFNRFNSYITLPNMDRELKKQIMTEQDWEKFNYLSNKLRRFQQKEYECLMEFQCPDTNIATAFTKQVISYNHIAFHGSQEESQSQVRDLYKEQEDKLRNKNRSKEQEETNFLTSVADQSEQILPKNQEDLEQKKNQKKPLFLVFFKNYLLQVSAAIKIQKMWRYYKSKPQQIQVFAIIQQKRACSKLQHWFRNIKWYHKRSFYSQLSYYVHQQINANTLYLHYSTYEDLPKIYQKTLQKETLIFKEQDNMIQYSPLRGTARLTWNFDNLEQQKFIELQKRIFPKWLRLTADQNTKEMSDEEYCGDIMHLIHVSAKIGLLQIGGMKYLKIQFASLQEAKYRAAALALITYRFRNNGYFIKLFTHSQISNYTFILSEETELKATYDINLKYDQNRCLAKEEKSIDNHNSLFLSSQNKIEFNSKASKICQLSQVESLVTYKESMIPLFQKKSTQKLNNAKQQKPIQKIEQEFNLFYNDQIYIYKPQNNQVLISGKNLNEQIKVQIEASNIELPNKRGFPQLQNENFDFTKRGLPVTTNDTSTKYAKSEFDSTVISFYKGNQMNPLSTSHSRYRSKPLLDNSLNNIVTDITLLKDQQRCQSRDFQVLLKDREEQSLIAKQKGIQDSKKRSYLIKEIKNMDKLIHLNEQKEIMNNQKKNREFSKEANMKIDLEQKLQRVEILKQIGMQTKSEEMWVQNFNRSQNYLVRQMTQINKKKAQDDLIKRNMEKANKVREKKLLGTSQQNRTQSSHNRNRTESSFCSSSSNQNNFMLASIQDFENQQRGKIASRRGSDRTTSLQPAQNQQQNPSWVQLGIYQNAKPPSNTKKHVKRLNTSSDVMYRTTTNASNPLDTITGLNTEPNELQNVISLESTFYGMNQVYSKNQKLFTEGDEKSLGIYTSNSKNSKKITLKRSLDKDLKPQTPFPNKIVHAVFPEEFYPISTGSNQLKLNI